MRKMNPFLGTIYKQTFNNWLSYFIHNCHISKDLLIPTKQLTNVYVAIDLLKQTVTAGIN